MDVIELSLIELFSCQHCRKIFYLRLPVKHDENKTAEIIIKEDVWCPYCAEVVQPRDQRIDHKFHFEFTCDACGRNQVRTTDDQPEKVSCICCREFKVVIPDSVEKWWSVCKPVRGEACR